MTKWIRICSVALMINIIFDLIIDKEISDFNIGTAFIISLFSLIIITIQLDKNDEKDRLH